MKALEFKSVIKGNQILIPAILHSDLDLFEDKEVRVIVLLDDSDSIFQQSAQSQFFSGYAATDAIYDTC